MTVTGKRAEIIQDPSRVRPADSEVDRLLCDASRAREWAGWESRFTLEQGLQETSLWVKDNLHLFKPGFYAV